MRNLIRRTLLTFLVLGAAVAWAASGDLDTSFDVDGVARTDDGLIVSATAVQSDGRIVVSGSRATTISNGGRNWLIRRYTTTGALDSSYGFGGEAEPFGLTETSVGMSHFVIDASDRLIGTGVAPVEIEVTTGKGKKKTTEIQTVARFAVARLDISGDLDTAFGDGGIAHFDVPGMSGEAGSAIAIQPNGRIVVSGYGTQSGGGGNGKKGKKGGGAGTANVVLFVTRLLADGSLDASFGSSGFVTNDLGEALAGAIGIQSDGGIVVGSWEADAYSGEPWALTRYSASGTVDAAFGVRLAPNGTYVMHRLLIDASDRILVGGYGRNGSEHDGAVVRYAPSGAIDTSFGSGGTAWAGIADRNEGRGGIALQSDGSILLAGTVIVQDESGLPDEYAYLACFDADGSLDTGFASGGVFDDLPIADRHVAQATALTPTGEVVVSGIVAPLGGSDPDADRDWFVARFLD